MDTSPVPLVIAPPPHPVPVFRILRQAYRDYLASGGAQTLVINPVATQAAAAAITVTGTVTVEASVPKPIAVRVVLRQSPRVVAAPTVNANAVTGAWTVTFPAGVLAPGSANATADTGYGAPVTTPTFTLT